MIRIIWQILMRTRQRLCGTEENQKVDWQDKAQVEEELARRAIRMVYDVNVRRLQLNRMSDESIKNVRFQVNGICDEVVVIEIWNFQFENGPLVTYFDVCTGPDMENLEVYASFRKSELMEVSPRH